MLTILSDPAGITGRRRIPWGAGTLFDQIAAAMPEGGADCTVRINGAEVDPLADPRMNAAPQPADEVVIVQRPEGLDPATWILIASFVLAAYTYTLIPKPVDQPTQSTSPNNQLASQTNIARAYQAIPDVYGLRRCWPDLIQPSTVEYVDNVKFVTEWLCVSRGKGDISAIKFAETPLIDISGATSAVFEPAASPDTYPENNDTTLPDVYETFESAEVNGQELNDAPSELLEQGQIDTTSGSSSFAVTFYNNLSVFDALKAAAGSGTATVVAEFITEQINDLCSVVGYVDNGSSLTFTFLRVATFSSTASYSEGPVSVTISGGGAARGPFTLPVDADQIWFNLAFLRGLVGVVNIEAEWWAIDGAGTEIAGTREVADWDFEASSYDQQFRTTKITPAAGLRRYRIQFTRTTPDLGNGADVAKLEELYAVRYYATKTLPGVTVVKVTTKATAQAIGFQDRKFNLLWHRKVRTLTSTTQSTSRNFARALVHLWAVAGNDVAELETVQMAAINASLGEDSKLARFDWSFDDANLSLGERLQIIANVARCVVWRDGTKWTLSRDEARTAPELQLDYRNLAAGGDSSISFAAHLPASEDGVELEYVDETTQATKSYVRLDISSGAVVAGTSATPKKVKLIGCATADQATNRAQLEARKLLYQRTSVSDTALADAASLGPGALVRWIDPHDFAGDDGLQAGEVLAIGGSTIETSEELQWGAETSGRMLFTGADGAHLNGGVPVVATPAAGGTLLATVPSGLFVRDDDRQLGSRYAFAVGLTAAEVEASGLYTVTDIRPSSDRTVALSMVNYDRRIYAGDFTLPAGVATETDTAFALASNIIGVGRANEFDTAFALVGSNRQSVGVATETDEAFAVIKVGSVGRSNETDTAFALTSPASAWNPSDKDADISLSGANTVATLVSTGSEKGAVRGVQARDASGDWAFEVDVTFPDGVGFYRAMVGIMTSSGSLAEYPGFDANGYGYWANSGNLYHNNTGSGTGYGASYPSGTVITVRLNGGVLTFYKDGVSQGSAATGITGTWFPAWAPGSTASGTRTGTLRTSGLTYLPSGSTAWG